MLASESDLERALAHVLWIGGPPDAGKTSIAQLLARKHKLQVYHFDRREMDHIGRADPARQPALAAFGARLRGLDERAFSEDLWVARPPAAMARETVACWSERFGLAIEDLLVMPPAPPIVAEGPGFFPECVAPLIADRRKAVWLVPSEAFKRASVAGRNKPGARDQTSDPGRATRNLIDRDLLMGRHVRQRARALGLTVYEVDGARCLDEMAALVEAHFAPWLSAPGPTAGR
jgi:hypothetical protein